MPMNTRAIRASSLRATAHALQDQADEFDRWAKESDVSKVRRKAGGAAVRLRNKAADLAKRAEEIEREAK